jgi:hypothetical protein
MDFRGKRTARILMNQVSTDPRLAKAVHRSAEKKRRSPGEEICHLLEVGIRNDPEATVYGSVVDELEGHSTTLNLTQPSAPPRKASQLRSREEGAA